MLDTFGYVVEPTGADSPSQNGGAEIYNNTLAVKTRTLLYGAGLPAKFWSIALLHSVSSSLGNSQNYSYQLHFVL
jgi:hypothetical protein